MLKDFPDQTVSELQKDAEWYKKHADYAEFLYENNRRRIQIMNRLYLSHNGKTRAESVSWLTQTYGKANRSQYIDYRIGRTKIDILQGEWLKHGIDSTVETINSAARTEKLQNFYTIKGAVAAKPHIEQIRQFGVDPMEGMQIPDTLEDKSAWSKLTPKDQNESVMQILIDKAIQEQDLVSQFSRQFKDLEIVSMVWGKDCVDEDSGDVNYEALDPRDAIYENLDRDMFFKKSRMNGCMHRMTINQILTTYRLTESQIEKLKKLPQQYKDLQLRNSNRYNVIGGEFTINVLHIEWKGLSPVYTKIAPKTNAQLDFDNSNTHYQFNLDAKSYEERKEEHDANVAKGKYEIEKKYKQELYELVRIGDDIFTNTRKCLFQKRSEDKMSDVLGGSYHGMKFDEVDGEIISMQQVIENFSNQFNIVMYQIMKEVGKLKGKIFGFNRALLPKGESFKSLMWKASNDSFIDFDTTAAGNMSNREITVSQLLQEADLGLSSTFPVLIDMKRDIQQTLNQITGINENREGQIQASSTATNAQSSIEASRTITENLFFSMSMYVEQVLKSLAERYKISYGLFKPRKGQIVLGDEKYGYLEVTRDIAFADYDVYLTSGRKYQAMKQRLLQLAEAMLNTKEIRPVDLMEFELANTFADSVSILKNSWETIQQKNQESAMQQQQAVSEAQAANMDKQVELAREDREDRQVSDLEKISAKAQADIAVNTAKDKNKYITENAKGRMKNENI